MEHPELYRGGGCIINGTNYKISGGSTLIDGTSKKIEFEPSKTWKFNEVINTDDVWSFLEAINDYKYVTKFYCNFTTPLFGGELGNGNNFDEINVTAYKNSATDYKFFISLRFGYPYPISVSYEYLGAYNSYENVWNYNDMLRTIALNTTPTGTFLSFLQHTATPVY